MWVGHYPMMFVMNENGEIWIINEHDEVVGAFPNV